jgi:hypothetical protein
VKHLHVHTWHGDNIDGIQTRAGQVLTLTNRRVSSGIDDLIDRLCCFRAVPLASRRHACVWRRRAPRRGTRGAAATYEGDDTIQNILVRWLAVTGRRARRVAAEWLRRNPRASG